MDTDTQTDTHTQTHKPSTVTLAAHARRGLIMSDSMVGGVIPTSYPCLSVSYNMASI